VGPVSLTVSNLERSLAFYRDVVGITALDRADSGAVLGLGNTELLRLAE
jgi:catechol 2,3-dioxygenase